MEWKITPGLTPYPDALAAMEARVATVRDGTAEELVWLLEHPPLYTSGTSAKPSDLLQPQGLPVYATGRGGQYTYHGPGQRIAYVVRNLKSHSAQPDIRAYVRDLERWIILILAAFGLEGFAREGRVGVWVRQGSGEAKIAAIGVRVSRWITSHGISLNVCPDLSHYSGIVPCGIREHGVTSMQALGVTASMDEVDNLLKQRFFEIFAGD